MCGWGCKLCGPTLPSTAANRVSSVHVEFIVVFHVTVTLSHLTTPETKAESSHALLIYTGLIRGNFVVEREGN